VKVAEKPQCGCQPSARARRIRLLDFNGHVAAAVLLQYGHHARWERLRAAGVEQADLLATGISPVSLEEHIRFHREMRAGEEVDVSCAYIWGGGKTFRVEQQLRHSDGNLAESAGRYRRAQQRPATARPP
jgi:acyl-CoA thioesterase FadM